jgi:hypothetical protein
MKALATDAGAFVLSYAYTFVNTKNCPNAETFCG